MLARARDVLEWAGLRGARLLIWLMRAYENQPMSFVDTSIVLVSSPV